ncbi:MAG: DUF86 domain-containing protein [Anaerolineae bacterium]|jgi:uncharacterized protein with HEPN domain
MKTDEGYLLDMLLAAQEACEFVRGMDRAAFEESRLHQNAVLKSLEVIGEAARRVSPATREAHPEIPWAEIIGMRNRLIHGYFEVDLVKVWETVQHDLPRLVTMLEPLIPWEESKIAETGSKTHPQEAL